LGRVSFLQNHRALARAKKEWGISMTTRYFPSAGEGYRVASYLTERKLATYLVTKDASKGYFIRVYDKFGEFQGVLQEDGSLKVDDAHTPHGSL
jgi:hypothetical protein